MRDFEYIPSAPNDTRRRVNEGALWAVMRSNSTSRRRTRRTHSRRRSRIGSTPSIEPSASQIAGVVNGERHRSRGVTIQNMHGATSRAQNASHRTTNVGSRPRADCVRTPKIQVMGEISAPSTRLVQPTTERDQATSSASTTTASSASTTTSAEPSTPTRRSARTARSTSDHRTPRSPHSPPADIAAVALRQA
jgi:hypothetical protein